MKLTFDTKHWPILRDEEREAIATLCRILSNVTGATVSENNMVIEGSADAQTMQIVVMEILPDGTERARSVLIKAQDLGDYVSA